jgi:hypothetical protein
MCKGGWLVHVKLLSRVVLILLASHAYMEGCFAVKTVVFIAHWTIEFEIVFLFFIIKHKSELAIRSKAPRYIALYFKGILKLELVKLDVIFIF